MDHKELMVFLLFLLAIALAYVIFFSGHLTYTPEGSPVDSSVFLENLASSSDVYLVMDVRSASPTTKQNILQCGVDFSGSIALGAKNLTIFSFENDHCITVNDADHDLSSCMNELSGQTVIYIHPGEESTFYNSAVMVGLGEQYSLDDCSIRVT